MTVLITVASSTSPKVTVGDIWVDSEGTIYAMTNKIRRWKVLGQALGGAKACWGEGGFLAIILPASEWCKLEDWKMT